MTDVTTSPSTSPAVRGAGIVLLTLASAQFLMTLDTSVMNVSIATVARDVGTTVTGIQLAITMYTLVMAALMIAGGKIGQIIGRKRAFLIGCVIYGSGSFVTGLAPNLLVLIIGWSVLEGIGAALILPSIVALVATNFGKSQRPRAYGLMAAASATAVATGPLIGGLCTTYYTWRVVFFGEVVMVLAILVLARRMAGTPADPTARLDLVGTVLSALGLGLVVYAILQSGSWGFLKPRAGEPEWFGLSPVIWLLLGGVVVFMAALEVSSDATVITWPMILAGFGIGVLASQLGAVTVSSAPDEASGEVGALQNTVTNLGASIGTALAGAVLIAALTASFLSGISSNPDVPPEVAASATVSLSSGVPFISDADLTAALTEAGTPPATAAAITEENTKARIDALRQALAVLAIAALLGLFLTRGIPDEPATAGADDQPVKVGTA